MLTDPNAQPVSQATVNIKSNAFEQNFLTDKNGSLFVQGLHAGMYTLTIKAVGYEETHKLIQIADGEMLKEDIKLVPLSKLLDCVVITGNTPLLDVEQHAIRGTIANAQLAHNESTTLPELLNRTPGIRIRQTGGLGANPDIAINGFQGRSIRYFRDGIPLDYLRDGYTLANIPVNSLQYVEVYKGVLPVNLGADALGGAVNLISRQNTKPYLDLSYEHGSFQTHRITVNGNYSNTEQKWFAGVDAFYNYSDNNYWADVMPIDPVSRNPYEDRIRLFHNGYESYYADVFLGIRGSEWADLLKFSIAAFQVDREVQHPSLMTDPYGAITTGQSSIVPTLRYKKSFLNRRLQLDQFFVYNTVNFNRTDTVRGYFDWYGNFMPTSSSDRIGESRQPSLLDVDFTNFTARTGLVYNISSTHKLAFNYVLTSVERTGRDPLGPVLESSGQDVLNVPAAYQKQVFGLAIESDFMEGKLHHTFITKHYRYLSRGIDSWAAQQVDITNENTLSGEYWGFADALKYHLNSASFVRFSAELANRLPEQDELFGNAQWIVPNFQLRPETSFNINLGYRLNAARGYHLEANTFFRNTEGMILLVPIQAPYAQYGNQENVQGYGLELDGSYPFLRYFTLHANATWQSLRLFGIEDNDNRWKNNARLRNTPYAFANLGLTARFNHILHKDDVISIYSYYNVMREFYLETIPESSEPKRFFGLAGSAQVNSQIIIPTQHSINTGLVYQPKFPNLSLGIEVKNLTNANLYDYFRVQRASRSFHVKLNYRLNSTS